MASVGNSARSETQTLETTKARVFADKVSALQGRISSFRPAQTAVLYACLLLAAAGFAYDERGKVIKCNSCGLVIEKDWPEPLKFHKEKSPNCAFFSNVPDEQEDASSRAPAREDSRSKARVPSTAKPPANLTTRPGKYPDYTDYSARLVTYQGWPLQAVGQSPDYLSKCGFFYIGSADRVRCFYCGITLRNWEAEDDPYEEHRNWAPRCTFIQTLAKPERHSPSASLPLQSPGSQTATGPTESHVVKGPPPSLPQLNHQPQSLTPRPSLQHPSHHHTQSGVPPPQSLTPRPSLQHPSHHHTQSGVPPPSLSHPGPSSLPTTPGGGRKQDAILESPSVQAVVSMGFARDVVEKVWRERSLAGQTLSAKELFLEVESFVQSQ